MKGDFTRKSFRKNKHYRNVNIQQGRVQIDADSNEQNDIQFHYEQIYLQDIIGKSGTKEGDEDDGCGCGGGFKILPNLQVCNIDNADTDELKSFIRNNFGLYWIGEEQHFTKDDNVFQISQGSHTAKIKLQRDDQRGYSRDRRKRSLQIYCCREWDIQRRIYRGSWQLLS